MTEAAHVDDIAKVRGLTPPETIVLRPGVALVHADCREWLKSLPEASIHAVVTDPPYAWVDYEEHHHTRLKKGKGGMWRIPPTLDGVTRRPVPRFTVLSDNDLEALSRGLRDVATEVYRALVPGGHVVLASNPLLAHRAFDAIASAGFERRGVIHRGVQTLRGGDRPKGAHEEFPEVSVMPRGCWEPWGLFRKPLEGTVAQCLRRHGTGGLRRPTVDEPLKDWIPCAPTHTKEKAIAPHPSLKPQRFLRQIVRAALPLGRGVVLDPFAGSGSTLAAATAVGYAAIGVERDEEYIEVAKNAFDGLVAIRTD